MCLSKASFNKMCSASERRAAMLTQEKGHGVCWACCDERVGSCHSDRDRDRESRHFPCAWSELCLPLRYFTAAATRPGFAEAVEAVCPEAVTALGGTRTWHRLLVHGDTGLWKSTHVALRVGWGFRNWPCSESLLACWPRGKPAHALSSGLLASDDHFCRKRSRWIGERSVLVVGREA